MFTFCIRHKQRGVWDPESCGKEEGEKVCEKNYLNVRLRRLLFIPDVLHNTSHINKIPQQTIKPQTACSKRHLKDFFKKFSPKLLLIVNKLQFSFLHFLWFHKLSKKKKQSISPRN
jgi:hypothetical protein